MDYAYAIDCTEMATATLARLFGTALERGVGALVTDAANEIERRLRWNPHELGEPQFRDHHLGLVCAGAVPPLIVHFSINESEHVVRISRFVALSGWGLEPEDD